MIFITVKPCDIHRANYLKFIVYSIIIENLSRIRTTVLDEKQADASSSIYLLLTNIKIYILRNISSIQIMTKILELADSLNVEQGIGLCVRYSNQIDRISHTITGCRNFEESDLFLET